MLGNTFLIHLNNTSISIKSYAKFEVGNENEDDQVSMNDHGRIRPHDRRIEGDLVRNLWERGKVGGDLGNIKMQIPPF